MSGLPTARAVRSRFRQSCPAIHASSQVCLWLYQETRDSELCLLLIYRIMDQSASQRFSTQPTRPATPSHNLAGTYLITVTGTDGANSCQLSLTVHACPTEVTCKSVGPIQLPVSKQDCSALQLKQDNLYQATGPVIITPATPTLQSGTFAPGNYSWAVTPTDGINPGCNVTLTILPCLIAAVTCKQMPELAQPPVSGACRGLALQPEDLYVVTGGPVTVTPVLPSNLLFKSGGNYGPYAVTPLYGSSPGCRIPRFKVDKCLTAISCADRKVKLAPGSCDGVLVAANELFNASGKAQVSPGLRSSTFFNAGEAFD